MSISILQALDDPALFAPWFKDRATWASWRAFLAALFALPMESPEALATYTACTGRVDVPAHQLNEAVLICGRRAGKSFMLALCAVFLACFFDYRPYLTPGEKGTIIVIASDRKQARVILGYIRALLTRVPMLKRMVVRETAESFDLNNDVVIEVGTASFRSARGYTLCAALCDEVAFWMSEDSLNPDFEILDAIRPGMATIPNAMLLIGSSPYSKVGVVWDSFKRHYGVAGDPVLVWKAPTRQMNPSVRQSIVDNAMARDPAVAQAEWMAEFRQDIASFIDREVVEACVDQGRRENAASYHFRYKGFVDMSGGSIDSATMAVAHNENGLTIIDVVREIPSPHDPESACDEFCRIMRDYGIKEVVGDRYSGAWASQAFEKRRLRYKASEQPKSELYKNLLPKLMAKKIRLVDNPRLISQLAGLERRTSRGGNDSIDHAPGGHDDVANSVAGVSFATNAPAVAHSSSPLPSSILGY
jgi:hypothetical protein